MNRRWQRIGWLVMLGAGLTVLGIGSACGEGAADTPDVEAALQETVDAWNDRDVESFLAGYTDAGFMEEFGTSKDAGREFLPGVIGDQEITLGPIYVGLSDETAAVRIDIFASGDILSPRDLRYVFEEGAWLIDGVERLIPPIPAGTTVVDLALTEYAFIFDASVVEDGNIAFNVTNAGDEYHEVALLALPDEIPIEIAVSPAGRALGVSVVGVAGRWEPGTETTLVLTGPLDAGPYGLFCFIEDADGTPHYTLGMVEEFMVP